MDAPPRSAAPATAADKKDQSASCETKFGWRLRPGRGGRSWWGLARSGRALIKSARAVARLTDQSPGYDRSRRLRARRKDSRRFLFTGGLAWSIGSTTEGRSGLGRA